MSYAVLSRYITSKVAYNVSHYTKKTDNTMSSNSISYQSNPAFSTLKKTALGHVPLGQFMSFKIQSLLDLMTTP